MPLIQVMLIDGRTTAEKTALIAGLTEAAVTALGAPRESVRVILQEVSLALRAVAQDTEFFLPIACRHA